MNQDEIIEIAKKAGFFINDELTITSPFIEDICISPMLKEFAKLVAAKEREKYDALLYLFQEWKEDHLSQSNYIEAVEAIREKGEA